MAGCDITDTALDHLVHSPSLSSRILFLNLSSTAITDYGVDMITKYFPRLIALNMNECSKITFIAVKKLIESALSLQALSITRCDKLTLENLYMLRDLKPDLFIDKHPELMDAFAVQAWRGYQIIMDNYYEEDEEDEDEDEEEYGDDHYHHDAHENVQQNQYTDEVHLEGAHTSDDNSESDPGHDASDTDGGW